jgi:hypothetical protein
MCNCIDDVTYITLKADTKSRTHVHLLSQPVAPWFLAVHWPVGLLAQSSVDLWLNSDMHEYVGVYMATSTRSFTQDFTEPYAFHPCSEFGSCSQGLCHWTGLQMRLLKQSKPILSSVAHICWQISHSHSSSQAIDQLYTCLAMR